MTANDVAHSATTDASGNIYVTGYTYGSLDGNTSSSVGNRSLVTPDPRQRGWGFRNHINTKDSNWLDLSR